jgi:hypothetical protein
MSFRLKKAGATYQRAMTVELNGLLYEIIECHIHYVTNSNRRHRSKTCPQVIISDLVKRDVPASLRRIPGSVEVKKETLIFSARLSLFKIRDVPAFLIKERRALV